MTLRTAQQKKDLCTGCPVARVADILGDSCSLLIVRDLLNMPKRFSELEGSLKGISTRTLTSKLKQLEHEGMVKRREYVRPQRVEYSLSKKGEALHSVIDAMRAYGNKYL
jgi:DNA-binding HxlR family transcriptional regulator